MTDCFYQPERGSKRKSSSRPKRDRQRGKPKRFHVAAVESVGDHSYVRKSLGYAIGPRQVQACIRRITGQGRLQCLEVAIHAATNVSQRTTRGQLVPVPHCAHTAGVSRTAEQAFADSKNWIGGRQTSCDQRVQVCVRGRQLKTGQGGGFNYHFCAIGFCRIYVEKSS